MTSPSAVPTEPVDRAPAPEGDGSPLPGELVSGEDARSIDLTRSGPPAEVLEQMARADAINTRLRESGRELSFALSADGCSLQIELRDTSGNLLRLLSAAEAVEIAGGAELEE
jgi:hypothetical protein